MKIGLKCAALAFLGLWPTANAQPLAKPLAEFDKLVEELRSGSVVGEAIRAGGTTVIPFAAVQFSMGSAGIAGSGIGGLGAKTVPLGFVIVEGDDVRIEPVPRREEKQAAGLQQLIQAILDRKVSFMVNGLNIGNAPGNGADLAAMMNELVGHTNVMVNGLNLGNLNPQRPATPSAALPDPGSAKEPHR